VGGILLPSGWKKKRFNRKKIYSKFSKDKEFPGK
jgi:hypothetical protein